MHIPNAAYRIQFNRQFDFNAAKQIVPYLSELGISHIYASPILKARSGSSHGYDVVDPQAINPELIRNCDLDGLLNAVRSHGLYWIQDIVPNHMAYDSENKILMDVLESGENSAYFKFFDIDWDHPYENIKGRALAPFLGKFYAECLENQEIQLKYNDGNLSVNYYNLSLPLKIESYIKIFGKNLLGLKSKLKDDKETMDRYINALNFLKASSLQDSSQDRCNQIAHAKKMFFDFYSSCPQIKELVDENISFFNGKKLQKESFDALDRLISQQRFRLSFWKVAAEEINYRRFFTINELISLKAEEEEVFNFTHDLILKLVNSGKINGLRVDHIDGLYDPKLYLKRLSYKIEDKYIIVEKVLNHNESLPLDWPVGGTTGYDFLNYVNGLLCQKENAKDFSRLYYKFTRSEASYENMVCGKKRLIIGKHLAGNIDNLAQLLKKISSHDRYGRDITLYGLKRALVEIMAEFPVYRTYINEATLNDVDSANIKEAVRKARVRIPGLIYEFNFIEKFLLFQHGEPADEQMKEQFLHFVMNFQQYTASLMAKGFEDTILYIYNKLISLNEVGGAPNLFGFTADEFHNFNLKRSSEFPHSFNATSTHDTKRGEDARARINVLSEIAKEWELNLKKWSKINRSKKVRVGSIEAPDANDEYALYQAMLGAFPFNEKDILSFRERMKSYIVKAVREAKVHTGWIKPDKEYEDACTFFVEKLLSPSRANHFLQRFIPFQKKIAYYGVFNSLTQTILKFSAPGVPDMYQGSELWELSLVDPDNRRPVDFKNRMALLADIKHKEKENILELIKELLSNTKDARIKLFLIYKMLGLRKDKEMLFKEGSYMPFEAAGPYKNHIIAFARNYHGEWSITVAGRFFTGLIKEGHLPLGDEVWADTHIILPQGLPFSWKDGISGQEISGEGKLFIKDVFRYFPAAALLNSSKEKG